MTNLPATTDKLHDRESVSSTDDTPLLDDETHQLTIEERDIPGLETPESLPTERTPVDRIPKMNWKPPNRDTYNDHFRAMLRSIGQKYSISFAKDGPLGNVDIKALILEIIKVWREEDQKKVAALLPERDLVDGYIRPDFFSEKNTSFWEQVQLFEKTIASNTFSAVKNSEPFPVSDKFKDENFEEYWGERLARNNIKRKKDDD